MRTGPDAVAASRRDRRNRDDYCLYHVQTWLDAPWSGPYAEDAWRRWGGQHKGDRRPPAGAPVYWHSPRHKYGHIALSVGGGRVRSTDWPRDTYVGEVSIDEMTRRWNLVYLGWSDRFSGGAIQGLGQAPPARPRPSTPPPRKAPDMFIGIAGRHAHRLITGDRYVPISEALYKALKAAGVPAVGISSSDHTQLSKLLQAE